MEEENMSKFANILHLLDVKNMKIEKREFPKNVRPFEDHMVCWIPIILPELKSQCATCTFHDIIRTQGKVDEFGINGHMTNQPDPLKKVKLKPTANINLREPRTIIRAAGHVHVCRHPKREGLMLLRENETACMHYKENPVPKKTKK